jgi:hypothetical protein
MPDGSLKQRGNNLETITRKRVAWNKGLTKNPLGATHDVVTRECETCSASFETKVKNINRGQGRFCSKKCNPNYGRKYSSYKEKCRANSLKAHHGIALEDYQERLDSQDGVCKICGEVPTGKRKNLHVDHCHETGEIRGLLCMSCNRALGWFGDRVDRLESAIRYLQE